MSFDELPRNLFERHYHQAPQPQTPPRPVFRMRQGTYGMQVLEHQSAQREWDGQDRKRKEEKQGKKEEGRRRKKRDPKTKNSCMTLKLHNLTSVTSLNSDSKVFLKAPRANYEPRGRQRETAAPTDNDTFSDAIILHLRYKSPSGVRSLSQSETSLERHSGE